MALLGQRAELPGGGLGKHRGTSGRSPCSPRHDVDKQRHGAPELAAWEERMRTFGLPSSGVPDEAFRWSSWFPLPRPRQASSLSSLASPPQLSSGSLDEAVSWRRCGPLRHHGVGVLAKVKSLGFLQRYNNKRDC